VGSEESDASGTGSRSPHVATLHWFCKAFWGTSGVLERGDVAGFMV